MVAETDLTPELRSRLKDLVQRLANGCKDGNEFGTFTPVCYDTAWVAMMTKPVNGVQILLFPDCFQYLLQRQGLSGGWGETNWPIDSLLNSLAALLCFVKHRDGKTVLSISSSELNKRIETAHCFISSALQAWDVEATVHVGFEILVPALLGYLSNHGVEFEFPGRQTLKELNAKKLAKFDVRYLYSKHITTLVHSLEAFIGIIDFNKLKHHLRDGAMLGSPAATAAYLMHADLWDDEAEAYLQRVHTHSIETGGIPSAFPSPIFESSWALSTLLSSGGVELQTLIQMGAEDIVNYISETMKAQDGLVGFAADMLVDADDTAKCIQVLSQTHGTASIGPESMIFEFNSRDCFRTFRLETSPSFSANCNVLIALLAQHDPSRYATNIAKSTSFLLEEWEKGLVVDKWNMSPVYSGMLFSQIITALMISHDTQKLGTWTDDATQRRLSLAAMNIVSRLLPAQLSDGSWRRCVERTAYAVLTISNVLRLPLLGHMRKRLTSAIGQGRSFLLKNMDSWSHPEYLWVEKVSYGSPILSESYCIAAMISVTSPPSWTERTRSLFEVPQAFESKMIGLCKALPLTKSRPDQDFLLPIVRSYYYLGRMLRDMPEIFPESKSAENKYLSMIPFTWVLSNDIHGNCLSDEVMWNMMQLSVLNFQADEYMESTVSELSGSTLDLLERMIRQSCGCLETTIRSSSQCQGIAQGLNETPPPVMSVNHHESADGGSTTISDDHLGKLRSGAIGIVLESFIANIMSKVSQSGSDATMRTYVSQELCAYFLAQIHHNRDNSRFSNQALNPGERIKGFVQPQIQYHDWVSTVAADDTSCPFSFAYFCSLIGRGSARALPDAESQYLAKSLCRHLAIMCRQYNDIGSLKRDVEEDNLNGLNFPEFQSDLDISDEAAKRTMMKLADHERKCLNVALEGLEKIAEKRIVDSIKTFVDVTDLFGQLYLIKDLQNKVK